MLAAKNSNKTNVYKIPVRKLSSMGSPEQAAGRTGTQTGCSRVQGP